MAKDDHVEPEEHIRKTDYGDDVAKTEGPEVMSTRFEADTGRRIKKGAVVFLVVLIVAFIAVGLDRYVKDRRLASMTTQVATSLPQVDVVAAQPVAAVQQLSLPGQTAAWHASTIYARVNGYVGKWINDIGDRVHQGQVLAVIETPDLDAQLAAARAQLHAAKAQILVRRAAVQFSKSTYERWRDSPKGVVSEQEREEKRADYDSATASLESAQADVALDQARVDQYVALSQFKLVTAPFDGVVTERYIDIGNLVTAGSTSATTPLYVITQNDPMRVFVDVPQSASADLVRGNAPVQIRTGGGDHRPYLGKVSRSSGAINSQARTMRVEIDIPNAAQTLLPGMYVTVAFELPAKGQVEVPAATLVFRSSGVQVARVDSQGRINFQEVTIARDDGNVVELGSGVAPGDRLALNIGSQIANGERVQANLMPAATAPAAPAETAKR